MKKVSKKEIRNSVKESLDNIVSRYEIADPSKKTNKLIRKVSKKISGELKGELKKHFKKMEKATKKTPLNGSLAQKKVVNG
jgi:hypothetical protein